MPQKNDQKISFLIVDCVVNVSINSADLMTALRDVFGYMEIPFTGQTPHLDYSVEENLGENYQIILTRQSGADLTTDDLGEFIFFFEKDMTIELQKIRSDLLFIHSAVLEYQSQGLLLVAPSGTGKSTTCWAMINSGFNYLSDELAPLNLQTMSVQPYPHALCLKALPPIFTLPDGCLTTSQTIHVPCRLFKEQNQNLPVKLKSIFYLTFDETISEPEIEPLGLAEAAANLYSNSLNILAHDTGENGLQAAISVAKRVKNYSLRSNHLDKTCEQIKRLLEN